MPESTRQTIYLTVNAHQEENLSAEYPPCDTLCLFIWEGSETIVLTIRFLLGHHKLSKLTQAVYF